jgi:predicted GNAT family N-acyltransferase
MERLRLVKTEEMNPIQDINQRGTTDPLERFKGVARDLTEKALEIVNRISAKEMSKLEPQAELVEEYYLLYHYLDFLKRFALKKA